MRCRRPTTGADETFAVYGRAQASQTRVGADQFTPLGRDRFDRGTAHVAGTVNVLARMWDAMVDETELTRVAFVRRARR
jgi:hypothetical protein